MIKPEYFIRHFQNKKAEENVFFGQIQSDYTSGRPRVIYDVDLATGSLSKPLPYLSSYTPTAGDRVMIIKGVIIGKIT